MGQLEAAVGGCAKGLKMLVLSLTGQCNFACRYCYAHKHPREVMSRDTAVRAVQLAAAGGQPFVLQFSGGEPMLAFEVLRGTAEYVREHRIPAIMQVQTNASLLSPDKAVYLQEARVGIGISLDGRPDVNDGLRRFPSGEGTCRRILQGASQLAAQGVEIGITCVVTDDNAQQLAGAVEMAYYLGNVRRLGFDLLRAQGRGCGLKAPGREQLAQGLLAALRTAERLQRCTGKKLLFSQLERVEILANGKLEGFGHCHAMNGEAAFVDARGNLYACSSLVGDETFRLGDVKTGIDPGRQKAVIALIQGSMDFCRQCSCFSLCGGGCFSRWYGSGCQGKAYDVECALKQVFIQWYREHQNNK